MLYDAVVVGGGPAGLSAAAWLARYRRRVVVVDAGEHRNRWVEQSHGYFTRDPASPSELLARGREQLARYPMAEFRDGRAVAARADDTAGFAVALEDGGALASRRLVLATGVADDFPDVAGFFDHYGVSAFHCPTCDGYEAAGKGIVAFGWSEPVAGFALTLLDWADRVTVVTDGRRFEGDEVHRDALDRNGVRVLEDEAVELLGRRGDLRGVRLRGGGRLDCEMAFFAIGHQPSNDLARQLGCELTEDGCIVVDDENRTTVDGVYAAGDVTPGIQLVQVAASKGAVAGVSCALSLRGEGGSPASPDPGPDVDAELGRA